MVLGGRRRSLLPPSSFARRCGSLWSSVVLCGRRRSLLPPSWLTRVSAAWILLFLSALRRRDARKPAGREEATPTTTENHREPQRTTPTRSCREGGGYADDYREPHRRAKLPGGRRLRRRLQRITKTHRELPRITQTTTEHNADDKKKRA